MINFKSVTDICVYMLAKYNSIRIEHTEMPAMTINAVSKPTQIKLIADSGGPVDDDLENYLIRPGTALTGASLIFSANNYLHTGGAEVNLLNGAAATLNVININSALTRWRTIASEILAFRNVTWTHDTKNYTFNDFITPDVGDILLDSITYYLNTWLPAADLSLLMKHQIIGNTIDSTTLLFGSNAYLDTVISNEQSVEHLTSDMSDLTDELSSMSLDVDALIDGQTAILNAIDTISPNSGIWVRLLVIVGGAYLAKLLRLNPAVGAIIGFLATKIIV